jgi:hypothetical protein
VSFALHSGFDFLWHVPAVPLLAAVAVGLAAGGPRSGDETQPEVPPPTHTQEVQ